MTASGDPPDELLVELVHQPADAVAIAAVIRDDTERWQERRRLREEVARLEGQTSYSSSED